MNIRRFEKSDTDRVLNIWLEGSLKAHHFIDVNYWEAQQGNMASIYLPSSTTFLLEKKEEGSIVGFISLVDDYIAALFIDVHEQNCGYGKRLLDYVKNDHVFLQLKVYQKNKNAIRFYEKNGFYIVGDSIDRATEQKEYVMEWKQTP